MFLRKKVKSLPPLSHYYRKLIKSFAISINVVVFSLLIGIFGYHYFGNLGYLDSLLNASMILTGMGPVNQMISIGGKLFASFYALYSGIAFLTMMALMLSPVLHRFMHRFHLEMEEKEDEQV